MEVTYLPRPPPTSVTVLSVCTNSGPGSDNFILSLQRLRYNYKILCQGQSWGGWKWRTAQYIEALSAESDNTGLFVLCDANDVLFLRSPDYLIEQFLRYNCFVVVGGEQGCWNDSLKKSPYTRRLVMAGYDARSTERYRYPNGGFVIGYRDALLNLLELNKEAEDDQMGYTLLWLKSASLFTIDTQTLCVGNIVATIPFFDRRIEEINEINAWNIVYQYHYDRRGRIKTKTDALVTNQFTAGEPAALHFPGGNMDDYNSVGKQLLGDQFQPVLPKNRLKNTVKKPWASSLIWLIGGE